MTEKRKKILIIDDDPDHLFIAKQLLITEGYEVLAQGSPFGVISLILSAQPDLVLVDVNMPGIPGIDFAAFFRADSRTCNIPVVLYSSEDERTLVAAVAKYRLHGYISKGDGAELKRKTAYFLGNHLTDGADFRKRLYAVD